MLFKNKCVYACLYMDVGMWVPWCTCRNWRAPVNISLQLLTFLRQDILLLFVELVWWVFTHPYYIFWTNIHGFNMEHSLLLSPRWLYWTWCQCAHLESPSPSWQISEFLWVPEEYASWSHSMDALVNVDDVFSGHHLIDGRMALFLLTTLLCRSHSARPKLTNI